jgi:cystathionine gamma-lyase
MAGERELGPSTRAVHAGLPEAERGEPFLPGPTFAAPYHLPGDVGDAPHGGYGRDGNPTWERLEDAIGELEGGEAVSFASGMAALAAILLPRLRPGDAVVLPADGYGPLRTFARESLEPNGVELRFVQTADGDAMADAVGGAALVVVETPSNPALAVCDIAVVAEAAGAEGALLAVDNSVATPVGQRPLELGADISLAAATKALSGHGDVVLGYVAARAPELIAAARTWRTHAGSIPGPFEAWLVHRSLATLDIRLERCCANAQAIAELVEPRVQAVHYPGLGSDPGHEVAARQMRRFGPVVSFDLGSRERAERFLEACELVFDATSFGGVHTTAERRARWGHGDDVGEGFIRLSAGIEDTADLLADVERALDAG